ncbi:MAG: helix-turn-helix domain-containing protein [Dysgonomonas sp.]|nr:helix-turn-helix domain-containing protein [Dysgonomonas sp.]
MHNNISIVLLIRKLLLFTFLSLISIISRGTNTDSLFIGNHNTIYYYNSDTIFTNYANKGFTSVISDLYEYYEDIFWNLPAEKKSSEIEKMRVIAENYNSIPLQLETQFIETLILPEYNNDEIEAKAKQFQSIIDRSNTEHIIMKLRSQEAIFDLYWRHTKYAKAFSQIHLMNNTLKEIKDDQFPDKGHFYFKIGEAYYVFSDYEKAIPILRKAIQPSKFYCDRANLQASNLLGKYYLTKGEIDSSKYYFRLAYNSHDKVKSRSMYDAIALSNLGYSLIEGGEYDEAISYFQAGLDRMLLDNDYVRTSETILGLAHCYLGKNNRKETKRMIDSSLVYIEKSDNRELYRSIYPLMSKYYSRIGKSELAEAYLDSTIAVNNRYIEKYNSKYILLAEQELFETSSIAKDEELKYQKEKYNDRIFYSSLIIIAISLGLVIAIILYRRNKNAYRALVQKNQDWAGAQQAPEAVSEPISPDPDTPTEEIENEPDEEDIRLMQEVSELMKKDKLFKDLDITLDSLSKQMNVNRNYLSKAINKTTGKNFNTFINEYRIKEAIKIMSDKKSDLISIDAIALEVGFGNRTSFYQSFKKITGLSPSDFRNNKNTPK